MYLMQRSFNGSWKKFLFTVIVVCVILASQSVYAQSVDDRKPVDMMLVIDNSCSMFPEDVAVPAGCGGWGNDPDFLRIVGVDLFVASLGFADLHEAEYQAGVVSLGDNPYIVSPLQPLMGARDAIARLIANPSPEMGTNMLGALDIAYKELRTSPNRRATNIPAVVLITDGEPYFGGARQSDADIEAIISQNPDIPFFIMLLQDPAASDYEEYIRLWERMQADYDHVFTYRIEEQSQIADAYNTIIAQLQSTVPGGGGVMVDRNTPYDVFVNRCVREIVIKVIHDAGGGTGNITIRDPNGQDLDLVNDTGVGHFLGTDNPVEVISIAPPRLSDDLRDDIWSITSDEPVTVFLDRQGAYTINFAEPDVSLTDIANVYLATERHNPNTEFVMRVKLTDACSGEDSQPIWGEVTYPDGQIAPLRIPAGLAPDLSGVYDIPFDFASAYPSILDTPGTFRFTLNAGSALSPDDVSGDRVPIATTQLRVDVGRGPYFASISPEPLICDSAQPAELTVEVGDYALAVPDTVRIRALAGGTEQFLDPDGTGKFSADLSEICTALMASVPCATQQDATVRLRLSAQLTNGSPLPPTEVDVVAQVNAPACTPTPTPTPLPTPTPTPTPIPDTDHDSFVDPLDNCPNQPGVSQFNGCPIPWWVWLVGGILGLGLLAFLILFLIPWIKVRLVPPPKGYILVCEAGRPGVLKSIYNIGMAKRVNKVTIGGNRKKAHIYVRDLLEPMEFYVSQDGDNVKIFDAKGSPKATFRDTPSDVMTSVANLKLRVGLDNSKLNKC